jgi:citrate lyase beta subunit
MMRARRALLYVPGDDLHKIEKATSLGVDCICMDLEDGVAANQKEQARNTIRQALHSLDFGSSEYLVRINPVGSGLEATDLELVLPARPQGIVIPKLESGEQLRWVSDRVEEAELSHSSIPGSTILIAIVESARGILNLREIITAAPRLQALIFGAEDYANDLGATRTPDGWEVFYARSAIVTHTAAADLQAIDQVYVDFNDTEGLMRDARQGANMGFSGKQIIHPRQVQPVQEVFTPSDEAIARAKKIVEASKSYQDAGKGAFALEGRMIDAPIIKSAQRVLDKARAAGKI